MTILLLHMLSISVCQAQSPAELARLNPNLRASVEAAAWRATNLGGSRGHTLKGQQSYGINRADFDHDGDLDLVVVYQSGGPRLSDQSTTAGKIFWLENRSRKSSSGWNFFAHLLDDQQLTPKDAIVLRAGGRHIVVVPSYLAGQTVLYETSDGRRWRKSHLPPARLNAPVRAVVADLNQDGSDDIVVTSIGESGDAIGWFRRESGVAPRWNAVSMGVKLPPLVGVDAGDVDRDGDVDLVCASEHAAAPYLLINLDGKGTTWSKQALQPHSPRAIQRWVAQFSSVPISQNHVKFVDLDLDGDLDCVETSLKNGYAAWREQVMDEKLWRFHPIAGGLKQAYAFDVGDLNRNGRPDLVVSSAESGVYLLRNLDAGTGRWSAARLIAPQLNWANIVRCADVDGDGNLDVLATDWGQNAFVWRNPLHAHTATQR